MKELFDELKVLRLFYDDGSDDNLDLDDPDKDADKGEPQDAQDKMYSEDEFKKAVDRRQAALKRARAAEEKYKELKTKIDTMPDEEEFTSLKSNYEKMQQQLKEMDEQNKIAELEKIEDEKERERAKMQQEFKKEREKFENELDKLRSELTTYTEEKERQAQITRRYRRQALEGSIVNAAATKAFNPQQIVRLLVDDFAYDETDDRWYKEVHDKDGKLKEILSVDEYVESFLNDPINENLLKAETKSGSSTPRGKKTPSAGTPPKEEPSEEMYKWASRVGFNIDKRSDANEKTWLVNTWTRLHEKGGKADKE